MMTKKKWLPIAIIALAVQFIGEAALTYNILGLNVLPGKYLALAIGALVAGLLITFGLLFAGLKKPASKGKKARRIIGIIFAAIVTIASVIGALALGKIASALDSVTSDEGTPEASVGIYVLKEDKAQSINDLAGYSFGIMEGLDDANTQIALGEVKGIIGEVATNPYESVNDVAKSLYDGDNGAVLVNEEYANLLSETDEFADWEEKARLVYEINISTEQYDEYLKQNGINPDDLDSDAEEIESQTNPVGSITEDPFIVYISGSDTRAKVLKKSRSDVNILAVVNPKTKMVLLLNTPRDYYVPNPAGRGKLDKLTHLGLYGVNNSIKALGDLYECDVNYYGQLNFTGFEKLIDAIGGIDVNSSKAFKSGNVKGFSFVKGNNHMSGEQALAFVRERYAFGSGDNMRGQNQMKVISAIITKLTSGDTQVLMNYGTIMDSMSGMFRTDLERTEIESLVKMQISDNSEWTIKSFAVTGSGASEITYSMPGTRCYVMKQNKKLVTQACGLVDKVVNGEILTDEDVQIAKTTKAKK